MQPTKIMNFVSGRSKEEAEFAYLEVKTDCKVVNALRRMQEALPRTIFKVAHLEDRSAQGLVMPYILEIISNNVNMMTVGFPQESKRDTVITGTVDVTNLTEKRRPVTTSDIQVSFDGKPVGWKPAREDRFMELRPKEGILLHLVTETSSVMDSQEDNAALFRIANVTPYEVGDNHWKIWYRLQDTMTVREVILDTIEATVQALQRVRKEIFATQPSGSDATFKMHTKTTTMVHWVCDKSIAYLIQHRCYEPKSQIKICVVNTNPDQINLVTLSAIHARDQPVAATLIGITERLEEDFRKMAKDFNACKKATREFTDMVKLRRTHFKESQAYLATLG